MSLVYNKHNIQLFCGDCLDILPQLRVTINSVITSPPYANQRKMVYGGISESDYPEFTLNYFRSISPQLAADGSFLINIRPHIKNGIISDYVLKTRMLLRTQFAECEELIWTKSDSPPLGSIKRPRRAWESILWFGKTGHVYCNTKASNKHSDRIGFENKKHPEGGNSFIHAGQNDAISGIARDPDYICIGTSAIESGINHPAMYPVELPQWLINLTTRPNDLVLDPFVGSGTTLIACLLTGRRGIGIEISSDYCAESIKRLDAAFERRPLDKFLKKP